MKKIRILFTIFLFMISFSVVFLFFDRLGYDKSSISATWDIVQDPSSESLDILFMGTSHIYCNINPVIINQALDINSNILASSGQPISLLYENLKVILKYVHPKRIVIDAYTIPNTVEKIKNRGNIGYLYNNNDGIKNPFFRLKAVINTLDKDNWLEGFSQLFRPMNTWSRFDFKIKKESDGRILGFYPREMIIKESEIDKDFSFQEFQNQNILIRDQGNKSDSYSDSFYYLQKILKLALDNNIDIYIIKAPEARYSEAAEMVNSIRAISQEFSNVKGIYNFCENYSDIGLELDDFSDTGHLNRIGAVKYTVFLTKIISEWVNKEPDFRRCSYIKDENFSQNQDGSYRYQIETFENTLVKFVIKNNHGAIVLETTFSEKNYIDMPRISDNNQLFFYIKEKQSTVRDYPIENIDFHYMKDLGPLEKYSINNFYITHEKNHLTIKNTFDEVPVQYAWYIYKDDQIISKQYYKDSSDTLEMDFFDAGNYYIRAYVRTLEKSATTKAVNICNFSVDDNGKLSISK